ncbi:TorF family putative porin [Sedimentitalea sp. JM2-8]|uniref:TorF family putative porin n=1 Tax=Sedimentitalea xiamensis TaxID=3050037 RepID=A0ABT7FGU7_9RHOB|nr:TorF family putative porin [Sedimentitalea xiamensis]MDK3074178.1 TorF family putative porin [Sedimentitalea xiamensis]
MDAPAYRAEKKPANLIGAAILAIPALFWAFEGKAQTDLIPESQLRYFAGLTVASDYVNNGISMTNGLPTIQPLLELDWRGFYAGTVVSYVRQASNRAEFDFYLGYRKKLRNGMYFDTGYRRFVLNDTLDCCGEFKLRLLSPLAGDLAGEVYFGYNPQLDSFNRRGRLLWSVTDDLTASAAYGETSANQNEYWDAGVTYALTGKLSVDLRYQGSETGDVGVVVKLSWATVENSLARILANPLGQ